MQVRIYKPKSESLLPLMLYFHGGGYISGNLDTEDLHCRIFAAKTPCVVVGVTNPLSPPALLDDIIDAGVKSVTWVSDPFWEKVWSDLIVTSPGERPSPWRRSNRDSALRGAFLSAQAAYHFMARGDTTAVSGCILLFAVAAHWEYKGRHTDKYTAIPACRWSLDLAKYI